MMVKKSTVLLVLWGSCLVLCSGCMQLALRLSTSLFPSVSTSIFEECDLKLAETSIPGNLKLMEGLLKHDPENREILVTLSMGFGGYSLLFVEEEEPRRASAFYIRARNYGARALAHKGFSLEDPASINREMPSVLKGMDKEDSEALFWTTVSWNAWINLNLDKPSALAQLGPSQACLERIMEIDSGYFHGSPCIFMGVSLSARSGMFGGDVERAREFFERALRLTERKFFLAQYYFARYYAVRTQDKSLFSKLLQEIIRGDPQALRDVCLINRVFQEKAERLLRMSDELFF